MADADLHSLDVLIKHDEILFGNIRFNSIGLVEQVENINNRINMINNAPAPDVYTRPEANEIFDIKADKTETYTKTDTDTLLDAKADKTDTYSKTETDTLLDAKADKSDTYPKTETDTLLDAKADKTELIDSHSQTEDDALLLLKANVAAIVDSYSKTEDDALLLLKVDKSDTYSKTETDTLLDAKADNTELIDLYSKTEDDALLLLKANVADLTNYVDLTSAQTITGQKQFGVISVSNISKLSKNDASILLAGGGDMLVSSLVTQPQLQDVRDIATGKSKAYVFSRQGELNDWMAVQDNVAKLVIGENLYIVDKQVTDYWWDGTDLKVLETELPEMSNVITTLGTATGGGNAITDISIDGNKTFNTTIHSVGIMVQTYDNSSVVCAGGGVRSIADIQSVSYSKSEDNALLLLKADKSTTYTRTEDDALLLLKADKSTIQTKTEDDALLILKADKSTTYTKTEDDALLLLKADKSTTYTKTEDDALLILKADKSTTYTKTEDDALLILKADKSTTYTKIETNNLLNNKADTGVSYTKGEDDALLLLNADKSTTYTKTQDDALLLLKAEKTQLIDSYTKGETNDLLNNKADNGVSYTKGEDDALLVLNADKSTTYTKTQDDALLLLKAEKTQLIDSYTKGETNNLLNNKADNGVSYTKGEDDALLLLNADKSTTYTKTQDDALLLLKADKSTTYTKTQDDALLLLKAEKTQLIDSYTKGETNNLLNNKANQSTTYTKIETDQLVSQIDVGDIDLTDYYNKTKTDELLGQKADTTELSNYMTLGTSWTINANKTFNNACRFVSSIDGMSTVTGSSFVKSGVDETVVLLRAGGTKPLSEFTGTPTDLSNYYTKTQIYSQTEANNKFVRLEGSIQQTTIGRLRYVSPFGETYDETQDPVENTYFIQSEVDAKLTNVVTTNTTQSINGTKTFMSNVSATGFAKTGKDDTSVLLAGGGDMLLSAFGGLELVNINYTSNVVSPISIMSLKCYRYGSLINFYGYIYMGNAARASGASIAVCTLESAGFPKYLFYANDIVFAGSAPYVANFRFGTDGKVTITIKALSGTAGLAGAASAYINVTYPAAN
ncbi:MAG: hypothetical protein EZS28_014313 [Streblomastix strix]|uniref:Uncharacterized protein n=1 Tax=Streblomastix strix TaxID=222440 RepID=A0A5J4W5X0_9EUKA|nr:MAG: hypothetical protein EZS28_014313 [Streblomastix strix]